MADSTIDYIAKRIDDVAEKVDKVGTELTAHVAKFETTQANTIEWRRIFEHHVQILEQNTASLNEHMRRTDLLEQHVKTVEGRLDPVEQEHHRRKAVNEWIKSRVYFMAKVGGALTAVTALSALARFFVQHL